jgi:endo-1,4-beta-xylanase
MITELDLDMLPDAQAHGQLNPYPNGVPDVVQERITRRYAQVFRIFLKHHAQISRVTFWGVDDGGSWLNNWPIKGRTAYPLLFDRSCRPKPALAAIVKMAEERKR